MLSCSPNSSLGVTYPQINNTSSHFKAIEWSLLPVPHNSLSMCHQKVHWLFTNTCCKLFPTCCLLRPEPPWAPQSHGLSLQAQSILEHFYSDPSGHSTTKFLPTKISTFRSPFTKTGVLLPYWNNYFSCLESYTSSFCAALEYITCRQRTTAQSDFLNPSLSSHEKTSWSMSDKMSGPKDTQLNNTSSTSLLQDRSLAFFP